MAYSNIHISRNGQLSHVMVDDVTTLPSLFASIYGRNELSRTSLGNQENTFISLRFFYIYYYKKYKRTFDYDFYHSNYNIASFNHEIDGFFNYLLGKQHRNDETDIVPISHLRTAITKANKITYGRHIRCVVAFFRYLNYRYMNVKYQDMSPMDAHSIHKLNCDELDCKVKIFNKLEVSCNKRAYRYRSISARQNIELNNMLIPSTPAFFDVETGEYFSEVVNQYTPFKGAFLQYRNYLIHRLLFTYGLRVGEVMLISLDSIGETQPDSRGNTRFMLIIQNLPDDVLV